ISRRELRGIDQLDSRSHFETAASADGDQSFDATRFDARLYGPRPLHEFCINVWIVPTRIISTDNGVMSPDEVRHLPRVQGITGPGMDTGSFDGCLFRTAGDRRYLMSAIVQFFKEGRSYEPGRSDQCYFHRGSTSKIEP